MRLWPLLLCLASLCAADDAEVRRLIEGLADNDATHREECSTSLERLATNDATGAVEKLIEEGRRSKEPEVAARCKAILDGLHLWERVVATESGPFDVDEGRFVLGPPPQFPDFVSGYLSPRSRDARVLRREDPPDRLICSELRTGREVWRADSNGSIVGGEYCLVLAKPAMRISLATGAVEWQRDVPAPCEMIDSPLPFAADAERIYYAGDDGLYALNARTGEALWCWHDDMEMFLITLIRGDIYVHAVGLGKSSATIRLDPASGKELWRVSLPLGAGDRTLDGGPKSGLVLLSSSTFGADPFTFGIEARTGATRWKMDAPTTEVWAEPEGARAWTACRDTLRVISLASGETIETFPMQVEEAHAAFLAEEGLLYVAEFNRWDAETRLIAFEVASRKPRWTSDAIGNKDTGDIENNGGFPNLTMQRLGARLVLMVDDCKWLTIEVIDPATGRVLKRHRPFNQ